MEYDPKLNTPHTEEVKNRERGRQRQQSKLAMADQKASSAVDKSSQKPPPQPPKPHPGSGSSSNGGHHHRVPHGFPNPPDVANPDPATLRDQWRFAIRQYSRWYSHAWGTAILAGVSFFALGWVIKGSNPLPSRSEEKDATNEV